MIRFFATFLTACFISGFAIAGDRHAEESFDKLFDMWSQLEDDCRGTPGDDPRIDYMCAKRDQLVDVIIAFNFCWDEQAGVWVEGQTISIPNAICKK